MNVFPSKLLITLFFLIAIAPQKKVFAAPFPSPGVPPGAQSVMPGQQQPPVGASTQPTIVTPQPIPGQSAAGALQPTTVTPQNMSGNVSVPSLGNPQAQPTNITVPSLGSPQPMGSVISQPVPSSVPPPPPVQQAPSKPMVLPPVVDYKKFRDPFKEPSISEVQTAKSELERYGVNEFKVTGVITGPIRMRAMLLAPNGKTHYVSENMKLGTRDGVIVKITTKTVVVREKVVNPLGEVELFDTEIGIDQPLSTGAVE